MRASVPLLCDLPTQTYMPSIVGAHAADASALHGTRTGKHTRYPTHVRGEEPMSMILGMAEK